MIMWVVDTCVIIDIISGDGEFATVSANAIDAKREAGLVIAPLTYIELAPSFHGDVAKQDSILSGLGIEFDFAGNRAAVLAAHKAWYEHVLRKRLGGTVKRPIADVLIGAYAVEKGGLITRNEDDFKTLYPNLTIFNPISAS